MFLKKDGSGIVVEARNSSADKKFKARGGVKGDDLQAFDH